MRRVDRLSVLLIVFGFVFGAPDAWTQQPVPSTRETDDQAWRAVDQRIQLVWNRFCALLRAGDVESALQYFEDDSRERYAEVLRSLGGAVRQLPASWSEIKMIQEFGRFARYSVVTTDEAGERRLHELVFVRDEDGRWFLDSL